MEARRFKLEQWRVCPIYSERSYPDSHWSENMDPDSHIAGTQPVLWNRNYLLRFRFWLLKSYGSGSGSGSNFWKVKVPVPVPTFDKVTVPVPVPAPNLDHKKQIY